MLRFTKFMAGGVETLSAAAAGYCFAVSAWGWMATWVVVNILVGGLHLALVEADAD